MSIETRFFDLKSIELRSSDGADGGQKDRKMVGTAAVFNTRSKDMGGFHEMVMPGAFSESLKSRDIRAFFNHDTGIVLGRTSAGTLRLEESVNGLDVELSMPGTQASRDLQISMERGDIDQMSIGFNFVEDGFTFVQEDDGAIVRKIFAVQLNEVSIVSIPAFDETDAQLRSGGLVNKDYEAYLDSLARSRHVAENRLREIYLEDL